MINHLEPNILECKIKWALGSITPNKASGGDGIPVELFQILKDDAEGGAKMAEEQEWGEHFLPHKFIKRTFKHQVNSTKQLLNAGRGHQAPRKATQVFERRFLIYAFWYLLSILYLYFLYNLCDFVLVCFFSLSFSSSFFNIVFLKFQTLLQIFNFCFLVFVINFEPIFSL